MSRLSIAIISREYPPFFGGGIGTYTEEFSRALAGAGHRVVVVTVSGDGVEQRETRDGVEVVRLPFIDGDDWSGPHPAIADEEAVAAFGQFSPVSVLAMQVARALPGLVDEFGIDAVEAPDTGALSWFALNARRLGRPCGARGWPVFITHLHSPTAWIERLDRAPATGRGMIELKRMERDAVRWADAVICPSAGLARWAEGHFGLEAGAVEVIRYPLGRLETQAGPPGQREAGECRILYAGRLEPRKGVDVLVAGFARAVAGGARASLELAGRDIVDPRTGGLFGAGCVERLALAARPRIHMLGPLRPEDLAAARRRADFAAAPAFNDNFPYSCMEAMAMGLPVIAAGAGGMAEMISGDGDGVLFPPGDVEGCAAAIARAAAMDAGGRESVALGARRRIAALCGTGGVIGDREAHFRRVLGLRGGSKRRPRREDADVVVIGDPRSNAPLREAIVAGADFAHGWVRVGKQVTAFGSPTLEGLAAGPRNIGPVAVSAEILAGLGPRSRPGPWELAAALARSGAEGAVVHDFIADGLDACPSHGLWPEAEGLEAAHLCVSLGPAMVAALIEIDRAHPDDSFWVAKARTAEREPESSRAGRGWRMLRRVHAAFNRLRGRRGPGEAAP